MQPTSFSPRGIVLFMVLVLVSVMLVVCLSFSQNVSTVVKAIDNSNASGTALELAQCAASQRLVRIWQDLAVSNSNSALPYYNSIAGLGNLDQYNKSQNGGLNWNAPISFGTGQVITFCSYYNQASGWVPSSDTIYVDVKMTTTARVPRITSDDIGAQNWEYRTVQYIVRFNGKSSVFNFVYFVNNYAWMYGSSDQIRIYGNVGANANCGFTNPLIDGYIYASLNPALEADGSIGGASGVAYDNMQTYQNGSGLPPAYQSYMAPTNPPFGNISYVAGYTGNTSQMTQQQPLPMPYLGDLSNYMDMAVAQRGTIQQLKFGGNAGNPADWVTLVNGVYGNMPGQQGMYATVGGDGSITINNISIPLSTANQNANGNVALIGTPQQPLKITGPVVITNDLVLRGTITGQGTIYTGRNLNIVGNVTYLNQPLWKQNDSNFTDDMQANNAADMVGFAAKGSVILGDYYQLPLPNMPSPNGIYYSGNNWWGFTASYFQTGFQNSQLEAYQTDPTDLSIGYYNLTTKSFSGDYTGADGGLRYCMDSGNPWTNNASNFLATTARHYYESSFPYDYVASICQPVNFVEGIFYTNHLFGGREDSFTLYGSLIARDEGDVFTNTWYQFYDPRAYNGSNSGTVNVFLPNSVGYDVWLTQEMSSVTSDANYQQAFGN